MINTLLTGIVIGILIAPDKGANTRQKISDVFTGYAEDAEAYINDTANSVRSKLDYSRSTSGAELL